MRDVFFVRRDKKQEEDEVLRTKIRIKYSEMKLYFPEDWKLIIKMKESLLFESQRLFPSRFVRVSCETMLVAEIFLSLLDEISS